MDMQLDKVEDDRPPLHRRRLKDLIREARELGIEVPDDVRKDAILKAFEAHDLGMKFQISAPKDEDAGTGFASFTIQTLRKMASQMNVPTDPTDKKPELVAKLEAHMGLAKPTEAPPPAPAPETPVMEQAVG